MQLAWAGGEEDASAILVTGTGVGTDVSSGTGDPDLGAARLAVVPAGALAVPGAFVPMAGRWEERGGALRFVPGMPFARGTVYAVLLDDDGSWSEVGRLRRPSVAAPPSTAVVAIHPDVEEVPQNLIRLSVTFSAAMEEGAAAGRVRLEDPAGEEIAQALLPMPPELWDRDRRRLTLLLEPGRIKRGLVPNAALGAPLERVAVFDLVVDAVVRDATGAPLTAAARRTFQVGPAVRARVDPSLWTVSWPQPASEDPLVVVFERPLDRALVLRCLDVVDGEEHAVAGLAALDPGALRWTFRPHAPWPASGLRLRVDTTLEDLAGNSIRRVFDRDLRLADDDPLDADVLLLAPR